MTPLPTVFDNTRVSSCTFILIELESDHSLLQKLCSMTGNIATNSKRACRVAVLQPSPAGHATLGKKRSSAAPTIATMP
jgi:hypothetical protein